jgi:hypothetical protein
VLATAEPLSAPRTAQQEADAILYEHQSALSCHRRAHTNLKQAHGAPPDERAELEAVLHRADVRMANVRARLITGLLAGAR